jgi:hypothetical protein
MAANGLTVVCAWCERVVTAASNGAGITHTICPSCLDRTLTSGDGSSVPIVLLPPPGYFGDAFKR